MKQFLCTVTQRHMKAEWDPRPGSNTPLQSPQSLRVTLIRIAISTEMSPYSHCLYWHASPNQILFCFVFKVILPYTKDL